MHLHVDWAVSLMHGRRAASGDTRQRCNAAARPARHRPSARTVDAPHTCDLRKAVQAAKFHVSTNVGGREAYESCSRVTVAILVAAVLVVVRVVVAPVTLSGWDSCSSPRHNSTCCSLKTRPVCVSRTASQQSAHRHFVRPALQMCTFR
jgi:hypothetical protein